MSTDFGINPWMMGNYDWNSMMPYFQKVWQTPNVNFKGSTDNTTSTDNTAATNTSAAAQTNNGAIPVTTPTEETGSITGALTGIGTVLAVGGGALYLLKKGNLGKAGEVVKSIFNRGKSESSSVTTLLKRLTAVKGKDNKIRFMIPGKTTTVTGEAAIKDLTEKYGIESAVQGKRLAYSPATSALESFEYTAAGETFIIHTEDGVIKRIVDKKGNEVLKRFTETKKKADASTFEKMENALKELVKEEKEIDESILANVGNIQYVNTYGDDVLRIYMDRYGSKNPIVNQFTTLERFDYNSEEFQKLALLADEKVFAEFAGTELMTKSGRFSKSRLVDGLKVSSFSKKVDGVNEYFFEGEKLIKIRDAAGIDYPIDSAKYIELAKKNEKEINKLIKKVYEDRTEIPVGATIIPG